MKINDIFLEWNIKLPNNIHFVEYLQINHSNNLYYIDRFPDVVGSKHSQFDLFYQEAKKDKDDLHRFIVLENKYLNVISKLWAYNKVYPISNLFDIKNNSKKYLMSKSSKKIFNLLSKGFTAKEDLEIESSKILEMYIKLAVRDVIELALFLEEYKVIIYPLWSCISIYFEDISFKEIVEKIVNVEGLYLRPSNKMRENII